jgi:putative transcriptional regulator
VRDPGHWHLAALAGAVVLLPAAVLHAALPTVPDSSDSSGRTSFAGQLLIASPQMREPFDHAVILVAQHTRDGALGIVINHPVGWQPIASLLEGFGADAGGVTESVRIFRGGPVAPEMGFVLHSTDYRSAETLDIDGRVALSSAADVLRDVGLGKGPSKMLVAFGYAGWAPSQLDGELTIGAWTAIAEDPTLVFDDDRSQVWTDAMARQKTERR